MSDKGAWWQRGVIYQIYPRSFQDSNHDGIGDLHGIIQRLDYLSWLGVDALWLSPIFPSPQADFGYDVANYTDIHHEYGTLADFDLLLQEAHQRNIKILLDLVPNHTSTEHAWFKESCSSKDNPKRDWYIWKDPKPDGSLPNNWLAYFGGAAWTLDAHTGQYYMHNFDSGQPELNWRNSAVQEAIFGEIRFWLERGVDGFRVDVIDRLLKHPQFLDNPINPDWREGDSTAWKYLRVNSEQQPEVHRVLRDLRTVFDQYPNRVIVGEMDYGLSPEKLASYYGGATEDEDEGDEIHLPFHFGMMLTMWDAGAIRARVDAYEVALPPYGQPNYVLGNHDSPRLISRLGVDGARLVAMLLLTLRGTPTLYNGDEIGMSNTTIPDDQILDPQGRNKVGFNRDECRTPMQWDSSPNAGFSGAGITTWLPLAPDYAQNNVATQQNQPESLLMLYNRLLHYRRDTPALNWGRYYPIDGLPEDCYAFLREYEGQKRLIVLNFAGGNRELHFADYNRGKIIIATHAQREGEAVDLDRITLGAYEGVIIEFA